MTPTRNAHHPGIPAWTRPTTSICSRSSSRGIVGATSVGGRMGPCGRPWPACPMGSRRVDGSRRRSEGGAIHHGDARRRRRVNRRCWTSHRATRTRGAARSSEAAVQEVMAPMKLRQAARWTARRTPATLAGDAGRDADWRLRARSLTVWACQRTHETMSPPRICWPSSGPPVSLRVVVA